MPPSSPLLRCTPTSPSQPHTLSLHDALPIYQGHAHEGVDDESLVEDDLHDVGERAGGGTIDVSAPRALLGRSGAGDRKSTRLNSSHVAISYAVFCLKKKRIELPRGLRPDP